MSYNLAISAVGDCIDYLGAITVRNAACKLRVDCFSTIRVVSKNLHWGAMRSSMKLDS